LKKGKLCAKNFNRLGNLSLQEKVAAVCEEQVMMTGWLTIQQPLKKGGGKSPSLCSHMVMEWNMNPGTA
jgi:hypothetical protein